MVPKYIESSIKIPRPRPTLKHVGTKEVEEPSLQHQVLEEAREFEQIQPLEDKVKEVIQELNSLKRNLKPTSEPSQSSNQKEDMRSSQKANLCGSSNRFGDWNSHPKLTLFSHRSMRSRLTLKNSLSVLYESVDSQLTQHGETLKEILAILQCPTSSITVPTSSFIADDRLTLKMVADIGVQMLSCFADLEKKMLALIAQPPQSSEAQVEDENDYSDDAEVIAIIPSEVVPTAPTTIITEDDDDDDDEEEEDDDDDDEEPEIPDTGADLDGDDNDAGDDDDDFFIQHTPCTIVKGISINDPQSQGRGLLNKTKNPTKAKAKAKNWLKTTWQFCEELRGNSLC
ncbi:hypothetical protein L6452_22360 [Arctium lappa]|uniref:Uncharacterized protein n=1 Tax=Arctium lappa TaxID=4217 RepID=A0ACB9AYR6_ARCLA|nr:hypothetical protein L6452_22360 [Arctium lappa]